MKKKLFLIFSCLLITLNGIAQNRCYILGDLDTLPIYNDTISFSDHVRNRYEFHYHDVDYSVIVKFMINDEGKIKNIDFPVYDEDFRDCYGNVIRILKTAKKFTPGKKDGLPVCTLVYFRIPYSDVFLSDKSKSIEFWKSPFDQP